MRFLRIVAAAAAAVLAGCSAYTWRPQVPEAKRTVFVPAFRNDSDVTELGDRITAQLLREIQRGGVFRVARAEDAAIEVQGVVKNASSHTVSYERRTGARNRERRFAAEASVSIIDRTAGKVLVDGRKYRGETTFLVNDYVTTGERDASGRIAEDIARRVADDLLDMKY